jgi:hypothetical protein
MKRTPLRRRVKLRARKPLQPSSSLLRTSSMAATDAQRAAVAGRSGIVCGIDRRIDPAPDPPIDGRLRKPSLCDPRLPCPSPSRLCRSCGDFA